MSLSEEMTFYRVHLDRGQNAYWAMVEESEELNETAQVLLDPQPRSFTSEVRELLEYVGPPCSSWIGWRWHGLATVLGIEAIHRGTWGPKGTAVDSR
ncbi:hypothetical protein AB0L99_26795 [Streptomyces sp. NPDC051954]|uniref:hypothetical protein n=1 Tax=unclassified Streptomyces TaxID=2593676 RepID=UPI0034454CA0